VFSWREPVHCILVNSCPLRASYSNSMKVILNVTSISLQWPTDLTLHAHTITVKKKKKKSQFIFATQSGPAIWLSYLHFLVPTSISGSHECTSATPIQRAARRHNAARGENIAKQKLWLFCECTQKISNKI